MPSEYAAEYAAKLTEPNAAMASVPDGSLLIFGTGMSEPPQLLSSLATRVRDGRLRGLRVFSGPPSYYAADSILAPDLADRIERVCQFVGPQERDNIRQGLVSYLPHQFHQIPRLISECMDVDLALTTVSPMEPDGHFTFGTNNDFISGAVRCARRVVVEVNEHMPRARGNASLHIRDVDTVIENHIALPPVQRNPGTPTDAKIAERIAELVPDGATLQVGAGGLPGLVCAALTNHRDLGIHSELMVPSFFDLVRSGVINGSRKTEKPGKHVFTLVVSNAEDLALLDDNPDFESHPVEYTNRPEVIARNDRMIAINSALQVDLTGQVNAECLGGFQYSGAGGQLDFVRGAYDSKDGKAILAFHATARGGSISRIVPTLPAGTVVTTPRSDTHYIATEFGVTNLKGKSMRERARALVELAHPDFREELERARHALHLA